MSAFIANTPTPVEPDITNFEFYPAVSVTRFREAVRLNDSITPSRAKHALTNAIIEVNSDLALWARTQREKGYPTLNGVPAEEVGGTSINLGLYERAVFNYAKADLTEQYRDYDSTLTGSQRADELDETVGHYRRNALIAIRAIIGAQRTTVELI